MLERICLTPPTHQFQAEPNRCSSWVASIIERIDSGGASNLMRVLIGLTEDIYLLSPKCIAGAADGAQWVIAAMLHK